MSVDRATTCSIATSSLRFCSACARRHDSKSRNFAPSNPGLPQAQTSNVPYHLELAQVAPQPDTLWELPGVQAERPVLLLCGGHKPATFPHQLHTLPF